MSRSPPLRLPSWNDVSWVASPRYDCVIGVSGGVDSTYAAYLTKKLGLRPLAVHLDNGWDSELAVANIEKVLKAELLRLGWPLLKTHDVQHLSSELDARGSDLAAMYRPLAEDLAEVYMIDRYPGFDLEEADWPDYRAKLAQVEALFLAVKARLPQPQN